MKKVNTPSNLILAIPVLVILLGIGLVYMDVIAGLYHQWTSNADYSHGLLVAPMTLYLLWERRDRIAGMRLSPAWSALTLLAGALILRIVGELGAELFTVRLSMLLCLIGGVWLVYGGRLLQEALFPLSFLFLMLPLPGFIYRNITFTLQLWSTTFSVKMLHLLGVSAYQEGNIIDIGLTQFQVIDACNGLRYILPLLTLSILLAAFRDRPFWKRLVLVACAVPVAIAANVLRIAGAGVLASLWSINIAEGFFHSFSGFFVFFFGLSVMLLMRRILMGCWLAETGGEIKPLTAEVMRERHISSVAVGAALMIILMSPMAANALGRTKAIKLQKPLSEFPLQFESWTGLPRSMDEQMWNRVGGQAYTIIDYHTAGKPVMNFYTAYYEYQRKGGDFIHSPKLCLPGAGWHQEETRVRTLSQSGTDRPESRLVFNELLMSKNGAYQLVYYWFQGRNRNFTSEYAAKFYMVWDGIVHRRTDGALVRLIMPLLAKEALAQARSDLDRFALFASTTLNQFLPGNSR